MKLIPLIQYDVPVGKQVFYPSDPANPFIQSKTPHIYSLTGVEVLCTPLVAQSDLELGPSCSEHLKRFMLFWGIAIIL